MLLVPPTRPETYSELLARSINLFSHAFKRAFIFTLLFSIVIFTPRLIAITLGQTTLTLFNFSLWSSYQLLLIAIFLAALWFFAAGYWRIHCVAINKHESFAEDFKTAAKKIIYLVGAGIIIFLIACLLIWIIIVFHYFLIQSGVTLQQNLASEIVAFCVLFIPTFFAFYMTTLFIFYFPLIVLENDRTFLALKQSAFLVWGNVWRTFSFQITPWIFYVMVLIVIKILFKMSISVYFVPLNRVPSFSAIILQMIVFAIFLSWSIACMIVQLQDLELRKKADT